MQLATFLETDRESILAAAVTFARTIPALHEMDEQVLRDHLPQLLEAISADLRAPQSRRSRSRSPTAKQRRGRKARPKIMG